MASVETRGRYLVGKIIGEVFHGPLPGEDHQFVTPDGVVCEWMETARGRVVCVETWPEPNGGVVGRYCAWCVGTERGLELQKQGYTGSICSYHKDPLMPNG